MISLHTPTATLSVVVVDGGGGVFCSSQNSKCQDLIKFEFSEGMGGGGVL